MHRTAALLATAPLLAGCPAGPGEGRRLAPLPSASSPGAVDVPPGPAATDAGPAAAADAARAWLGLLTAAGASGDTTAVRVAADPACTACASLSDFVEAGHRDGTVLRGFAYRPVSTAPGALVDGRVVVDLVVDVTGGTRTTAAGESQVLVDRAGVRNRMTLERRGDRWVVVDLVQPR